jgi:hypothetical protein
MKKKNKKTIIIIGFVLVLIIIFTASYFIFGNTPKVIPPPGGKLLENCGPNGNSVCFGIKQESSYFKCDADVCAVTGELGCNSNKGGMVIIAELLNGGDALSVDLSRGNGGTVCYRKKGMIYGSTSTPSWHCKGSYYVGTFSDGRILGIVSDNAYVCVGNGGTIYSKVPVGNCASYSYPRIVDVCPANTLCSGVNNYECNWKFCPSTNTNFAYCNKLDSFTTPWVGSTTPKYELKKDDSITFNPTGYNNNVLSQSQFRFVIDKYTLACAVTSSNNDRICSSEQKYCKICPDGYTFAYNKYCYYIDGEGYWGYADEVCWNGNGQQCKSTSVNKYLACDGVTSDVNKCNTWKTQYNCPSGQKCYVNGQTSWGMSGVGSCKCDPSQCSIGTRKPGDSSNWYQECMASGGCSAFVRQDCPSQNGIAYIYDDVLKKCVPPTNSQNSLICSQVEAKKCNDNNLVTCKQYNMNGCKTTTPSQCSTTTYYAWDTPGVFCTGRTCKSDTTKSVSNAWCEPITRCALGSVSCDSDNIKLVTCKSDGYDGTMWDTVKKTCDQVLPELCTNDFCTCVDGGCQPKSGCDYKNPVCTSGQKCLNNQCVSSGCAFGDVVCSDSQECDKSNNKCVCKTTTPYCSTQGAKICSGNGYLVCNVPTGDGCYKWTTTPVVCENPKVCSTLNGVVGCNCPSTSCSLSPLAEDRCKPGVSNVIQTCKNVNGCGVWTDMTPVCNEGWVCRAQSPAKCVMVGDAVIQSPAAYGTNELINGINVSVSSNVGDNKNVGVVVMLLEAGQLFEAAKVSTQTNDQGVANVNFNVVSLASKTLTIKAQISLLPGACDDNVVSDNCILITRDVEIKPKLNLLLNAPSGCVKDRVCKVTYKVTDTETGNLLTTNPAQISLSGGYSYTNKEYSEGKGFEFTPTKIGTVNVDVSVSKTDYLNDNERSVITITTATVTVDAKITGKEIGTTGISTGSQPITFDVRESGVVADCSIDAYVLSPAGVEKKLNFIKTSSGLWSASYDFAEAGKTYTITGKIVFADPNKADQPIEYSFATLGGGLGTGETSGLDTGTIVWVISGVVVGVIVIVVLIKFLRKKKK